MEDGDLTNEEWNSTNKKWGSRTWWKVSSGLRWGDLEDGQFFFAFFCLPNFSIAMFDYHRGYNNQKSGGGSLAQNTSLPGRSPSVRSVEFRTVPVRGPEASVCGSKLRSFILEHTLDFKHF